MGAADRSALFIVGDDMGGVVELGTTVGLLGSVAFESGLFGELMGEPGAHLFAVVCLGPAAFGCDGDPGGRVNHAHGGGHFITVLPAFPSAPIEFFPECGFVENGFTGENRVGKEHYGDGGGMSFSTTSGDVLESMNPAIVSPTIVVADVDYPGSCAWAGGGGSSASASAASPSLERVHELVGERDSVVAALRGAELEFHDPSSCCYDNVSLSGYRHGSALRKSGCQKI